MREAAVLANVAASVVVGEVGTAPITAEKFCARPNCATARHELRAAGAPRSRKNGGTTVKQEEETPVWMSMTGFGRGERHARRSPSRWRRGR